MRIAHLARLSLVAALLGSCGGVTATVPATQLRLDATGAQVGGKGRLRVTFTNPLPGDTHLIQNPAGLVVRRSQAAELASGEVIVSIDDDALFTDPKVVNDTLALFSASDRIGAIAILHLNCYADGRKVPMLKQPPADGRAAHSPRPARSALQATPARGRGGGVRGARCLRVPGARPAQVRG